MPRYVHEMYIYIYTTVTLQGTLFLIVISTSQHYPKPLGEDKWFTNSRGTVWLKLQWSWRCTSTTCRWMLLLGPIWNSWGQIIGTNPPGKVAPKDGLNKYSNLDRICCWLPSTVWNFWEFLFHDAWIPGFRKRTKNSKPEGGICLHLRHVPWKQLIFNVSTWASKYYTVYCRIKQYCRWCKAAKKGSKR